MSEDALEDRRTERAKAFMAALQAFLNVAEATLNRRIDNEEETEEQEDGNA